jgi:hypothetical protein
MSGTKPMQPVPEPRRGQVPPRVRPAPRARDLDITMTQETVTRVVNVDLGRSYQQHTSVQTLSGALAIWITPYRMTIWYKRDKNVWRITEITIIGRPTDDPSGSLHQRTFAEHNAPTWAADIARAFRFERHHR